MRSSILSAFRSLLRGGPVYVRITSKMLRLRDVASGREKSFEPVLLIAGDGRNRKYRLGETPGIEDRAEQGWRRLNGFDHPRTVLNDFLVAEQTLRLALRDLFRDQWFMPSPVLVLHPLEKVEGGLTSIERRALMELGEGAGARKVYVWEGREMTDTEVRETTFPSDNLFTDD